MPWLQNYKKFFRMQSSLLIPLILTPLRWWRRLKAPGIHNWGIKFSVHKIVSRVLNEIFPNTKCHLTKQIDAELQAVEAVAPNSQPSKKYTSLKNALLPQLSTSPFCVSIAKLSQSHVFSSHNTCIPKKFEDKNLGWDYLQNNRVPFNNNIKG